MLIRPRVMALFAAVCVLAPMTLASAAQAHRGGSHFRRHGEFQSEQVSGVCAQAGVAVSDHVHAFKRPDRARESDLSVLSEAQTKELVAACEKLAAAFAVKHKAVEGASKTFWEALKADRTKLDEACPALTEHHEHGFWEHTELEPGLPGSAEELLGLRPRSRQGLPHGRPGSVQDLPRRPDRIRRSHQIDPGRARSG